MTKVKAIRIRGNNPRLLSVSMKDILESFKYPKNVLETLVDYRYNNAEVDDIDLDFEEIG